MKRDQSKWDNIYTNNAFPVHPSSIVEAFYQFAKTGNALDIAAGNGRNAKYLAKKGFTVDAIDISKVGLDLAENGNPNIRLLQQDLDYYALKNNHYDLIININYLNRRLFPFIVNSLKPSGFLIFQTFIWDHSVSRRKGTSQYDHYLLPNELLHSFLTLHIHRYCEEESEKPKGTKTKVATLVGQKR